METKIPTIKVKYLVSVDRNSSAEAAAEVVDLMAKLRDEQVAKGEEIVAVGVELSGDPRSGEFNKMKPYF